MRYWHCLLTLMFIAAACKKTPVDPPPLPVPEANGSYVGWGRPGGTAQNVWLQIVQSEGGAWSGQIQYNRTNSLVTVTEVTADEDTIRFEYTRGNTYRCLGVLSSFAISIYILEPSGQPTYVLNREEFGLNLSGDWSGLMYSNLLGEWRDAELFMDQQSDIFIGSAFSSLSLYTVDADLNDGVLDGTGFYFSGITRMDNLDLPVRFDGAFVYRDSIAGSWQISLPDGQDGGQFRFVRSF